MQDDLPPPAGNIHITGDPKVDAVVGEVLRTNARKLAEAGPPVWTIRVFGIAIKMEFNLNTLIAGVSLLGIIAGSVYTGFNYVSLPARNTAAIAQLRAEMGQPGSPDYLPAAMRGVKHRMDRIEKQMQDSHADTINRLNSIAADIAVLRSEDGIRFDRLDTRIDRLVETQGGSHGTERHR